MKRLRKNNINKTLVFINIIILSLFSYICVKAEEISIVAVGDIMLSRFIGKDLANKGYNHAYEKIQGILSSGDVTFGNLECPISERGKSTHRGYLFRGNPDVVKGLVWAGFDVLSLANNHAMDYGTIALLDTIKILKANKIHTIGAGRNLKEARRPIIFRKKDLRVGFLAYCFVYMEHFCADEKRSGIVPGRMSLITEDIKKLKETANIVIVSFHWGKEYSIRPSDFQVKIAHQTIDAGADLIIGHHPHVLQAMEFYKDKPIFYSLGNFIFDQAFGDTPKSAILKCIFTLDGLKNINIIPVIRTYDTYYPQVAQGEDREEIISQILGLTEPQE